MVGTAKTGISLLIALGSLVSGCSGVQEFQSRAEAVDASIKWVKDGGEYFFELEPIRQLGSTWSDEEWKAMARKEQHRSNCAEINMVLSRQKVVIDKFNASNGTSKFHKRSYNCLTFIKEKLSEDNEKYNSKYQDMRHCVDEENQRVCYEYVGVKRGERVAHDANFESEAKRYFRWWTR